MGQRSHYYGEIVSISSFTSTRSMINVHNCCNFHPKQDLIFSAVGRNSSFIIIFMTRSDGHKSRRNLQANQILHINPLESTNLKIITRTSIICPFKVEVLSFCLQLSIHSQCHQLLLFVNLCA